jgi:hypothetical protein
MDRLTWVTNELQRLVNELKANPLERKAEPAAPDDGWTLGKVSYWDVKEGTNARGKPYVRGTLGIMGADGFMSTFDEEIIHGVDPLNKGERVEFKSESSKCGKYVNLVALRRAK